jgi:hypothetical protein
VISARNNTNITRLLSLTPISIELSSFDLHQLI